MFTVVGFYRWVDTQDKLTYITPLPDVHLRVEGNNVIVPEELPYLFFVHVSGRYVTSAQVEAPSLRRVANFDVFPFATNVDFNDFTSLCDLTDNPLSLEPGEPLRLAAAEGGPGAQEIWGLLAFSDGPATPVKGEFYTVKAIVGEVVDFNKWVSFPLSIVQTLPAGRYAVVGCRVVGEHVVAARLVFVGLPWRPGLPGLQYPSHVHTQLFRYGRLGIWGEFRHDQPPSIDILAYAECYVEAYLDIMKI